MERLYFLLPLAKKNKFKNEKKLFQLANAPTPQQGKLGTKAKVNDAEKEIEAMLAQLKA